MFGPYRLVELLGRGGMGEVWRAVDTSHDDRVVALKLLGPQVGADPDFARRFRREASLVSKLGSPYVVPIHRYGEIEGRLYLDMQLVSGADLAALLDGAGPLPVARAVGIIDQAARGLAAAHAAGLVHRDVKPSNILVTTVGGEDHVYVIDFGLARRVDAHSMSGGLVGTPAYMAPERFEGTADHRADVYALGAVLYETLTGQPPFPAVDHLVQMYNHLNTPPPRPSMVRPDLTAGFDEVVARAMAKDPAQRFAGVEELAAAARGVVSSADVRHTIGRPHQPAAPAARRSAGVLTADVWTDAATSPATTRSRRPLVWAAAAVLTVVGLLAAVLLLPFTSPTSGTGTAAEPRASVPSGSTPIVERVLAAHSSGVSALATAELNGRPVLISGGLDGVVQVWDLATGQLVMPPLIGHTGGITALAVARIGAVPVIVSGGDETVRVWDLATGRPIGQPRTVPFGMWTMIVADVSSRPVIITGGSRSVWASDLATGDELFRTLLPDGAPGVVGLATDEREDGAVLITAQFDGTVREWDLLGAGTSVGDQPFIRVQEGVRTLSTATFDGLPRLVTGGGVGTVEMWSPVTGDAVGPSLTVLDTEADGLSAVATADLDGRPVIIVGSGGGTVRVWDPATGAQLGPSLTDHTLGVSALTTARLGSRTVIVAGDYSGTIHTWDLTARTQG